MREGIDQAKLGSWMIPMHNTRLAISSELDVPPGGILNGTVCKTLASGGNYQLVRNNNTNERLIRIQSRPVLCANNIPIFKPANALEEILVFDMPYKVSTSPTRRALRRSRGTGSRGGRRSPRLPTPPCIPSSTTIVLTGCSRGRT